MKTSHIILPALGVIVGFAIGYTVHGMHSSSESNKAVTEPLIESAEDPKPEIIVQKKNKEKELLLQAIHELDLTVAELEEAQAYIDKLERNTQRYNWLVDYWQEKGFGAGHQLHFQSHNDYKPSEDMIKFFGWDDEQVDQMAQAGKRVKKAIQNWESEHSTCIEDSEKKKVYRLDPVPIEVTEAYRISMNEILGPDDYGLLATKLEKTFETYSHARTASMTIGPAPEHMQGMPHHNPDEDYMIIKIEPDKDENGISWGTTTSIMPYTLSKTIPHSWNHIFKLEGENSHASWHPAIN